MNLNSRQRLILEEILNPITIITQEYLSKKYNVSERTIRSDIVDINDIYNKHDFRVSYKRKEGYVFEGDDYAVNSIKTEMMFDSNENRIAKHDRIFHVLQKLALTSSFVSINSLTQEMYLSNSSISLILSEVQNVLNNNDLELEKKRGKGIRIIGNESSIRQFIIKYGLLDKSVFNVGYSFKPMSNLYQDVDFDKVNRIIRDEIDRSKLIIYDQFINNLILHVYIVIKRIQSNCYISTHEGVSFENKYIDEIVGRISDRLEVSFRINLSNPEKNYIAQQLVGKISNYSKKYSSDPNLYKWMMINLARIDNNYSTDFMNDSELQRDLFTHLFAVQGRLHFDTVLRNPLIEEILKRYPLSFEIALFFCDADKDFLNIESRDEIGYIAIHFAASIERSIFQIGYVEKKSVLLVGTSGLGSAKLLEVKLLSYFKNRIKIDIHPPKKELTEDAFEEYDLILSTLPNNDQRIMFINSFPDDSELQKVAHSIFESTEQELNLRSVFREQFFSKYDKNESRLEVVTYICKKLYQSSIVEDTFLDHVNKREQIFDTCFGDYVAIPHPMVASSHESIVYTYINEEGIDWGNGKMINVVFLLALKPDDTDNLSKLYDVFVYLIENASILIDIKRAENFKSFIEKIEEISYLVG